MDNSVTLKKSLADWTDWDVAGYRLALAIGLMEQHVTFATEAKHVFWTNNAIGNALNKLLDSLCDLNVLERRESPDMQYRWNPGFRGSWE